MELSLKDRILVKGLMIFVTLGIVFEPIISRRRIRTNRKTIQNSWQRKRQEGIIQIL